ncbi:MAG: hypothetical protein ACE5KQ_05935 [Thermoplasmata archaeon]
MARGKSRLERKKPIWLWTLVATTLVAAFFVLLHLTDDFTRGGSDTLNQVVIGVTSGLLGIVWLMAIALSVRQEPAGYAVVMFLGFLGAYIAFEHTAGVGPSLTAIADTSGIFFAWVVLAAGVASILAILFAGYGLLRDRPRVGQEA